MKLLAVIAIALTVTGCMSQSVSVLVSPEQNKARISKEWQERFPEQHLEPLK